ncbi:hypothetical protein CO683_29625 [Bradyrhizobium ottawaense]|uniref:Uncharacterized protein n=1 Tax=Bradyrhizobium ottawaense TaxID=931866 RepID=A0A2U8P5B2_9BRAD|nr:hypothetical protein CIT37_12270 [Bradyrhizobium ottawaense]PDT65933.1 hypothetical protein CO683_29625 [Bradyrhizobium ottawaense]
MIEPDRCRARDALPLPLAGEGWGGGVSATGHSLGGESPHPALRADLPRKRERLDTRDGLRSAVNFFRGVNRFTTTTPHRAGGGLLLCMGLFSQF